MDDGARRLRDRSGNTRLLILAQLQAQAGTTLSDVAKRMGITVQAVSAHGKALAKAGLLEANDGTYHVTPKGLQELHEGVRRLRDAVSGVALLLDVIQVTSAVASQSVKAGQEVALYMEDGDLAARPGRMAPSRGTARNNARRGEEVVVDGLRGMVRLEPGRLTVVTLPGPGEGGVARVDRPRLAVLLKGQRPARVAAHGTGARILARQMVSAGVRAPDFEFAADQAAFNAAERGLDVLLLATRDRLQEVLHTVERLNQDTLRRVPVEILEAPEATPDEAA
jgi:putative transcriptional regulator